MAGAGSALLSVREQDVHCPGHTWTLRYTLTMKVLFKGGSEVRQPPSCPASAEHLGNGTVWEPEGRGSMWKGKRGEKRKIEGEKEKVFGDEGWTRVPSWKPPLSPTLL